METVLVMRDICKSFFGVLANDHVSLEVKSGEVHALLGENGAGKTTLMNILYGLYRADSGVVTWKGNPVVFQSPHDAIACKIGMVHQHFTLVPRLTVSQNITLGQKLKGYPCTDRNAIDQHLSLISQKYGLEIEPRKKVSALSVGEQQRVEIMKLLSRDIELLILDEPTAVLTPGETERFFQVLRKLKADGKSVIIITHRIPEVMEISDMVTVLRDGKCVCTAPTSSLSDKQLASSMIGRNLELVTRKPSPQRGGSGLLVEHLSMYAKKQPLLSDITLSVGMGEVLGIAGVEGNGQKYLAEAILGLRDYQEGHVSLGGRLLDGLDVAQRKRWGIGYISDDRQQDGLLMDMNLSENMLLRSDRKEFLRHGLLRAQALRTATMDAVHRFAIKTHSVDMPVRLLSGGNQQKLILAREISRDVKLVVAFQPTRGLDIGATEFVRKLLLDLRDHGCCILLISGDLEEVFAMSDSIAVLHGGRVMGTVMNNSSVDMTEIGLMMAGKPGRGGAS